MITLVGSMPCFSQPLPPNSGYSAVGTYSQHFNDVFSYTSNQASLSQIKTGAIGVLSERRFMLKELTRYCAAVATPTKLGGVALGMDFTGSKDFSQSKLGLAYGRSLGEKAGLGIQFNYARVHISGYGDAGSISVELGCLLHLTEKLHGGCHVYNPFGWGFGAHSEEKLPSVYTFGLGYEVSEQLLIHSIIEKEGGRKVNVNLALHYAMAEQFFLRGGISSGEGFSFAGAGLLWKNFRTDLCASWHPRLGFSPSLLLVFRFDKTASAHS